MPDIDDIDQPDTALSGVKFVYCMSHMREHPVGVCTVPIRNKIPLWASTIDEAAIEIRDRNFPDLSGETRRGANIDWSISGGIQVRR